MSLPSTRFAFFLTHPIQYISPLLKALATKADVKAYYFSDASVKGGFDKGFGQKVSWDVPLLEGYEHQFIKNYSSAQTLSNRFFELINPGAVAALGKEPSRIIVTNGWMYLSIIITIITAKLYGKEVWLRAENPLHQELRKRPWVLTLKRFILGKLLFPLVNKFLYIGSQNKKFFEYYGAKEHQLVYTPYSVDNQRFLDAYRQLSGKKEALRVELGIPLQARVILFTAKYISPKRPLDLLQAFAQLNVPDAFLVMVGDGPLRGEMEAYFSSKQLKNVQLTGFINQASIAKYYAAADVFVLCSGMGETWGLSVNEAMNFALPVVVSETCGSSYDLVLEGENGFTFKEGDIQALTRHLKTLLTDASLLETAGHRSLQHIQHFTINVIVDNMVAAAQTHPSKPANVI